MVKRILLLILIPVVFSSCAFFGASAFPLATSIDIGWFLNMGELKDFYILDNGADDELLVLVNEENSNIRVLIFDTSLNLRGFLSPDEDPAPPVITDGVGFVDHEGDFIIGETQISRYGTTDEVDLEYFGNLNMGSNTGIIPYSHSDGTDYYLRLSYFDFDADGDVDLAIDVLSDALVSVGVGFVPEISNYILIDQSGKNVPDIKLGTMYGEIFSLTPKAMFDHVMSGIPISGITPDFTISNSELTQWVTRCNRGYLLSQFNGEVILIDFDGIEILRINNDDYHREIVTIDYDSEYYYFVDRNDNVIRKERLPW